MKTRCAWAASALAIAYHDREWGVPVHDDRELFEFLLLEGAQAGLSWEIVLRKRERYRALFANFDPQRVARFTDARLERIVSDKGIVRNRLKVFGARTNAKAFLRLQKEFGSFDAYLWRFAARVPGKTELSGRLSRDLRARGFTFVGPTICYAFLQAVGVVNDHARSCFRYRACSSE